MTNLRSKLLKYNIEDVVRPIQHGEDIGRVAGTIASAVKGPVLLNSYVSGSVLGIPYTAILGGFAGNIAGAIVGYTAINVAYKLTRDIIKTSYNLIRHPVKSVKSFYSGIKNLFKKPYKLITKPLAYIFMPALKKKAGGNKNDK